MTSVAEEKYGRYGLCFRITRAKSSVGHEVKPFSTDAVSEPTTFAICCEFHGRDGNARWIEVSSSTAGFGNYADVKQQDDRAVAWLMTLWHEWLHGSNVEPWIARQFEAIRQDSQRMPFSIYGKSNFSERELEIAAEEWHDGLRQAEFWDRILPGKQFPASGLVGSFGMGNSEKSI
jgi:hypothetical protein